MTIKPHLEGILSGKDLSFADASALMKEIIAGSVSPASIGALMIALRVKGESVDELAAFASVMRESAVRVAAPAGTLDTCGTGGEGSDTFNVSTAAALVAAGMGIPVAKHGGRSASSKCGSADVLRLLGVNVDAPVPVIERCIEHAGIGFMFAPNHHPGMKHVAPVRKELGIRSIFNLLGPLSNPAGARLQLLGVYDPALCDKFAKVLRRLGSANAMVVCGDGALGSGYLDELSIFGPSHIAWLRNGEVTMEQLHPAEFGLDVATNHPLTVPDAETSARMIRELLDGAKGPARDIVVLNAAAAARIAGKAADWPSGLRLAAESIDAGHAKAALGKLAEISNTK